MPDNNNDQATKDAAGTAKPQPKSQLEREREAISAHRATIQEAVDLLMDANEGAAINSHANRVELANKLKAIIGPNKG